MYAVQYDVMNVPMYKVFRKCVVVIKIHDDCSWTGALLLSQNYDPTLCGYDDMEQNNSQSWRSSLRSCSIYIHVISVGDITSYNYTANWPTLK